jgi:putative transposase
MRFEFMKDYSKEFEIEKMAKVLGVSRSGYYDFLVRKKSLREAENEHLKEKIKAIHKKRRGVYGSPRIHNELKNQGEGCSRRRVAKLMRAEGIQAKMRKRWKKTTVANERAEPSDNHLNQNFIVEEPDKVWVSDITYVWTEEGWLYIAIVLDLFSRNVVGLSMGERLESELVLKALKQAIFRRGIKGGLMHHSDRGSQYTSHQFKGTRSRGGKGCSLM